MLPNIGSGTTIPSGWTPQQTRDEETAIKMALTQDIQEGIIGAEYFTPKHVIIITWRNTTFNGGTSGTKKIVSNLFLEFVILMPSIYFYNVYFLNNFQTNTFQAVMATDEILSYCLFNYDQLKWTSATNAGGGPGDGLGGYTAFVSIASYQ